MFSAHTAPTTGRSAQRYPGFSSLGSGLKQCGTGVGFFFHAAILDFATDSASLS
jgi:hypothetical protein